ncbi:hypothetical protein USDA257_p00060 (plasmid) [Sinorhizobium fredii USDA 257]|uniref:Uncharacterized protein n=1 Tax=Sinorhizobium fredii (strain USDA 257) TaxID=1185652 RepID=I3XFR9_SINF2|nr:hypothetical protein USDA257_p00060 [Sinorhizobium fredii USDA 257]
MPFGTLDIPNAHRRCDRSWDDEKKSMVFPKKRFLLTIT